MLTADDDDVTPYICLARRYPPRGLFLERGGYNGMKIGGKPKES